MSIMPGKGNTDLKRPPTRYRPQGKANFETKASARKEDLTRVRILRDRAKNDPLRAEALLTLADKLDPRVTLRPTTLASSRYMRHHRGRFAGWLWRLHFRQRFSSGTTYTLLPSGLHFTPEELWSAAEPKKLKEQLRADLNRAGIRHASGFLIAGLHGEFNQETGKFQLHWHGFARRGHLAAVRRLRQQNKYKTTATGGSPDAAKTPVRIRRKELDNLPAPFTYIVQGFWPSKIRDEAEGQPRRRGRLRIPEPAFSEYLLWLDQWELSDMILMIRMRVIDGRLQPR